MDKSKKVGVKEALWTNPGIQRPKMQAVPPKTFKAAEDGEEDVTPAPDEEQAPRDKGKQRPDTGINNPHSPEEQSANFPVGGQDQEVPKVQILDLHTENPVVSYNGSLFSCQWASNIGTELLFTSRDRNNHLPALRHLPKDVDLLAASSIRLISKPVDAQPRFAHRPKLATSDVWVDPSISIPVGKGASDQRKDQARFLERLTEIKEIKGETDEVTINARKRNNRIGLKAQWDKKRNQEMTSLKRIVAARRNSGEVEKARERLRVMEEEDLRTKDKTPLQAIARRRSRKKNATNKGPTNHKGIREHKYRPDAISGAIGRTLSETPDLDEDWEGDNAEDDDLEIGVMDLAEGRQFANEELYDEDAPFEEDDTPMQDGWQ